MVVAGGVPGDGVVVAVALVTVAPVAVAPVAVAPVAVAPLAAVLGLPLGLVVPLGAVAPAVVPIPTPALHDPVVGVWTGVVSVVTLGVVTTTPPPDAVPLPVEGSVVETVVVSVLPCEVAGMTGAVTGATATGTIAAVAVLAESSASSFLAANAFSAARLAARPRAADADCPAPATTVAVAIGAPWRSCCPR